MPGMIVGAVHPANEKGWPCRCGCQQVVGLPGSLVQDDDTPKLAGLSLPVGYYAFDVPSFAGGQGREHVIAYTLDDLAHQAPL